MSDTTNTELLEDAEFLMDYWTGTLYEKLIDYAIKQNDLDYLHRLVQDARNEMYRQEYNPSEADSL